MARHIMKLYAILFFCGSWFEWEKISRFTRVFNVIWSKFASTNNSSINIYRVDIENGFVNPSKPGNELYYYGIAATPPPGWIPNAVPSNPVNQYTVARANNVVKIFKLRHRKNENDRGLTVELGPGFQRGTLQMDVEEETRFA